MTYERYPKILPIRAGTDSKIQFSIQNEYDSAVPDYSSGSLSVTFTPEENDAFTNAGVLDATPATAPQTYVLIADTDTSGFTTPQLVRAVATHTRSGGAIDKVRFSFDLIE